MEVTTPYTGDKTDAPPGDVSAVSPAVSDRDYEAIEIVYTPTQPADIETDSRGETTDGKYAFSRVPHSMVSLVFSNFYYGICEGP